MEYSFYDLLKLFGSLALFLYGMKIMSEGLQKFAGDRLRRILTAMTTNRVTGVLTGVLITALVQSSSATTVMVVSFVNAGLLTLSQSIGVIMGANIGTTVTAWIISALGFKVDIAAFALPLLAFGIPLLFSQKSNRKSVGEFIFGFSFLFMGLSYLKSNAPDLSQNPDMLAFVQNYTDMGFLSILLFVFIGTILTMVVQASAATMAITLIMCANGWISFELGAALVLGENIGTTITANLAALTGNTQARRAALAHLAFNVFGVIWVLVLFVPFTEAVSWFVENVMGSTDPAVADENSYYSADALPEWKGVRYIAYVFTIGDTRYGACRLEELKAFGTMSAVQDPEEEEIKLPQYIDIEAENGVIARIFALNSTDDLSKLGAVLASERSEDKTKLDEISAALSGYKALSLYSVAINDASGNPIDTGGRIIRLSIPESEEGIKIACVDDFGAEIVSSGTLGEFVTVETETLRSYAVVSESGAVSADAAGGLSGLWIAVIVLGALALASVACVAVVAVKTRR